MADYFEVYPTVEVIGPKGKIIIAQKDLLVWRAKGYQLLTEATPQPPAIGASSPPTIKPIPKFKSN